MIAKEHIVDGISYHITAISGDNYPMLHDSTSETDFETAAGTFNDWADKYANRPYVIVSLYLESVSAFTGRTSTVTLAMAGGY